MDINALVSQIQVVDGTLKSEANKAVNTLLTLRNWLIGYYLVVYEQNGSDRATYGERILQRVAEELGKEGLSYRSLRLYRQFYLTYPFGLENVLQTIGYKQQTTVSYIENIDMGIWQTPSAKLQKIDNEPPKIWQTVSAKFLEYIFYKLSFSHVSLLLGIDNDEKRAFYSEEAVKGTWSVSELKRQINTLLYERSGLSVRPDELLNEADRKAEKLPQATFVRDLYTFEFLGLPIKHAVEEADLETALLDHLQELFIEMGHGLCLEARQKRILIGDEYFFIDLVFYHRVLKCHVLVELKVDEFKHSNAGQLNMYINYYKKEVKLPDDNDPIGILLVTNKNNAMVEYAVAGMDEQLFVRKYMLQLPDKHQLQLMIERELKKL